MAVQGRVYVVSVIGGGGAVFAGCCAGRVARPKNSPAKTKGILIPCCMDFCRFIDLRLPDSAALAPEGASGVLNPATIVSRKIFQGQHGTTFRGRSDAGGEGGESRKGVTEERQCCI